MKYDTLQAHVNYMNHRYGIVTQPEDHIENPSLHLVANKYLPPERHITREDMYEDLASNFLASHEWHKDVQPLEGMADVVQRLAEKYQIWVVTARAVGGMQVMQKLFDTYTPNCIAGIHCVWTGLGGKKFAERSKRDFVKNFEGTKIAFFDDSPKEIRNMHDIIPSYLFDPTGRNDNLNDIKLRVRSWKEIGELLL